MRARALALGVLLALVVPGPAIGAPPELGAWCTNHEDPFSVPYPSDWWVHPPDPSRDIQECERFGPEPFDLAVNDALVWVGESIGVQVDEFCQGFFYEPHSVRQSTVGGYPATRLEYVPGYGAESPTWPYLRYLVRLSEIDCGDPGYRIFDAWTYGDAPGYYEENKAILDAMMGGLQFTETPDTATQLPRGPSPLTWLGAAFLVLAGFIVARRRPTWIRRAP